MDFLPGQGRFAGSMQLLKPKGLSVIIPPAGGFFKRAFLFKIWPDETRKG
jgi:hypothetical protein